MFLPEAIQGERWTEKTARLIFPILVWCAKNGKKITYGQLDRELVRRKWSHSVMAVQYGYPAGAVGYALLETSDFWDEVIPPLNALIVNKATGIPGSGVDYYLTKYVSPQKRPKTLSFEDRAALTDEVANAVFHYRKWDNVLELYGFQELLDGVPGLMDDSEIDLPIKGVTSGRGESKEHRELKEYVATHPSVVSEFGSFSEGKTEYLLYSADRIDVFFDNGHSQLGVEVKASNADDAELARGIFQCLKYRTLLRGEQKVNRAIPNANAILVVSGKLPDHLVRLADLLEISFACVDPKK